MRKSKGQQIKYKMVKYQVNEKADKNEEEVGKEEEVGQDADTVYGNRKSQRTWQKHDGKHAGKVGKV